MKRFFTFIMLLLPLGIWGQGRVTGVVSDIGKNPLPDANVLVFSLPDSVLVKGAITGSKGIFSMTLANLQQGYVEVSLLGFRTEQQPLIAGKTRFDFILKEQVEELKEVVLAHRKQLFEKQPDRLVVNVQNSVTSSGGTALEVLEKSPGVAIDRQNGTIGLNGKSGVGVMINGKLSRMPANALLGMLSGMGAQNIDTIELITNPPAKYEAAGSALININLLDSEHAGTNGSYGGHLGYNNDLGWALNFSINNRSEKWDSFLSYSGNLLQTNETWLLRNAIQEEMTTLVNQGFIDRGASQENHNIRLGTTYSAGKDTDLSLLVSAYRNNYEMTGTNEGFLQDIDDSTVNFTGDLWEKNLWKHAMAGIGLDHRFANESLLSFYIDYLRYDNDQPARFDNVYDPEAALENYEELVETRKTTPLNIWVTSTDYSLSINEHLKLETGLKASFSGFRNDFEVQQTVDGTTQILDDFTNMVVLNENIYATYLASTYTLEGKWGFTAGLRFERTVTQLGEPGQPLDVDRDYGNFFPSFTVNRKLGEAGNLSFSYGKRISRPAFNDLAPFAFFQNPSTLVSGNANLRPAITDNIEFTYQPNKWFVTLSYSRTKNQIAPFQPFLDDESGTQLYRADNLDFFKSLGVQLNLPVKAGNWLDFQNTLSLHDIRLNPRGNAKNDVIHNLNLGYQGSSTFILPKNFWVELTANYQSRPSWFGTGNLSALFRMDFGIKKKLGEYGGTLNLVVTDIFDSYQWEWQKADNAITDFDFNGFFKPGIHGIRLSYTRNFGNKKMRDVQIKSGSDEERGRVNK